MALGGWTITQVCKVLADSNLPADASPEACAEYVKTLPKA
jgi:hypothetical protein